MKRAITGADVFDGETRHQGSALLLDGSGIAGIVPADAVPREFAPIELDGGLVAPGFIDLQVNGGGGVLFNEQPDCDGIRTICRAHARFGTTALLATLITDTVAVTEAAIEAGIEAAQAGIPGFLGLHLEGPHLSVQKKGAHDPALIRKMVSADLARMVAAAHALPHLMVTVAPESVSADQVGELDAAGVVVSIGHTAASFDEVQAMAAAGAGAVTHLFNAMSPLTHRQPGAVGAALRTGALSAGLIADGIHVDSDVIDIALAAKKGPGAVFLVTDAMSTIGTDQASFQLNGRTIRREGGKLTLEDGTLAGADLDMVSAVRFMAAKVGLEEALRMASLYPARCLRAADRLGHFGRGAVANIVHIGDELSVDGVWIAGKKIFQES